MKKLFIAAVATLTWTACGNKTNSAPADADSAQTSVVADTLNTVEAVVSQVDSVYTYWNQMREHYSADMPTLDERFGTREWQKAVSELETVQKDCECGGYFDFGDEGPLDPWTYDCYEGAVSADSVKAQLLPDGTAEVRFLVKDAVTTKGRPMRWLMRIEDGQWRVANIYFDNDGGIDLLEGMKDYTQEYQWSKSFDITKYLDDFRQLAAPFYETPADDIHFDRYALVDVDRDGTPEVYVEAVEQVIKVVYSIIGSKPVVLTNSWAATDINFFEHGVGAQGSCGTGCMTSNCTIVEKSLPKVSFRCIESFDMEGNPEESINKIDGKDATPEQIKKLFDELGENRHYIPTWHPIDQEEEDHEEATPPATDLNNYAE